MTITLDHLFFSTLIGAGILFLKYISSDISDVQLAVSCKKNKILHIMLFVLFAGTCCGVYVLLGKTMGKEFFEKFASLIIALELALLWKLGHVLIDTLQSEVRPKQRLAVISFAIFFMLFSVVMSVLVGLHYDDQKLWFLFYISFAVLTFFLTIVILTLLGTEEVIDLELKQILKGILW